MKNIILIITLQSIVNVLNAQPLFNFSNSMGVFYQHDTSIILPYKIKSASFSEQKYENSSIEFHHINYNKKGKKEKAISTLKNKNTTDTLLITHYQYDMLGQIRSIIDTSFLKNSQNWSEIQSPDALLYNYQQKLYDSLVKAYIIHSSIDTTSFKKTEIPNSSKDTLLYLKTYNIVYLDKNGLALTHIEQSDLYNVDKNQHKIINIPLKPFNLKTKGLCKYNSKGQLIYCVYGNYKNKYEYYKNGLIKKVRIYNNGILSIEDKYDYTYYD